MTKAPAKILVVRFSSLGDVILTTPVYRNLKRSFPQSTVVSAVKEEFAGVLEGNPFIDRVLAFPRGGSLLAYLGLVRGEGFDVLIDLHGNLRSRFLSALSGIPQVVRYRKAAWQRRLYVSKRLRAPGLDDSVLKRYLSCLEPLGVRPEIFPPEVFPASAAKPAAGLRILIVQTAFLGDAVLTTPLFQAIRKRLPSSRLSLLCTPEIEDVFRGNANLDEVLVMDKRGKEKGPASLWSWGRALRGRFDVAVLPHRSFRSALLAWLAGIPVRIGFKNSQGRMFLTQAADFDWKMHDAERNLKLLEPLGVLGEPARIDVPLGGGFDWAEFSKAHRIPEGAPLVGMNPGSVWATKRWPAEGFAAVADRLIEERGAAVLLFGSERDRPAVDGAARAMKREPVNLCGKTDLKALAAAIARCSLFVTNDSGPMHLATAAGVPVVAIFGPTTRELGFFPYGEKSVVVERDLPCRPCTLHGGRSCPLGHFRCMKEVTPEMVLGPCLQFLRAGAARP